MLQDSLLGDVGTHMVQDLNVLICKLFEDGAVCCACTVSSTAHPDL